MNRAARTFRDDIDPAKTWILSDSHFGHRNIAEFCHRPDGWESLMLENIAQAVPDDPDVTLLHLGDLCYRGNAEFRALIAPHIQPKSGLQAADRGQPRPPALQLLRSAASDDAPVRHPLGQHDRQLRTIRGRPSTRAARCRTSTCASTATSTTTATRGRPTCRSCASTST